MTNHPFLPYYIRSIFQSEDAEVLMVEAEHRVDYFQLCRNLGVDPTITPIYRVQPASNSAKAIALREHNARKDAEIQISKRAPKAQ